MNNKTEQKKEYVKPIMKTIVMEREIALLCCSEPDGTQEDYDVIER